MSDITLIDAAKNDYASTDPEHLEFGLGRKRAADRRDRGFLLAPAPAVDPNQTKYWPIFTKALDQGSTPRCVEFAWKHMIMAGPMTHGGSKKVLADLDRLKIYENAQKLDEWDGEDYDGTSVRAGAKWLQAQGYILEYRWAWDAITVRNFLLTRGPVVLGTDWYERMFRPDGQGFLRPEGYVAGGHAYLAVGYNHKRQAIRILNSWSPAWGEQGRAWLHMSDLSTLLSNYGEACSAIETNPGA